MGGATGAPPASGTGAPGGGGVPAGGPAGDGELKRASTPAAGIIDAPCAVCPTETGAVSFFASGRVLTPPATVPTLSGMTRIGTIEIRVTPEERTAIRALAKADNRTVSDWVRLTLLRTIIPGEPMKLTVTQIREATLVVSQIIREARPMPQRGKLRLARLHMKLLPEFTTIEAQRDALIQEHGVPALDPVTNEPMLDKWMVPPENMADFNAAWAAIADDEIDVDVTPIPMADLDTGTGNGGIEATEIIILGDLISE